MALIQLPKVYTDDLQGILDKNKDTINMAMNGQFKNLVQTVTRLFGMVWASQVDNGTGGKLTPQQVLTSFGTDAASLFVYAQAAATMINTIVPGTVDPTPPYHYTINQDGTVTVGSLI